MIVLEVNGLQYQGFKNVTVSRSMADMASTFSFTTSINDSSLFPIKRGSSCRVIIGSESVVDGFIENIRISYDAESHNITLRGRDKTADIIDSSIIGAKNFNSPISLEDIISKVIQDNGITDIKVVNDVDDLRQFTAGEIVSAKNSQKIFEFIEKYARKRQVLLTTDGNGNVLITRAARERATGSIQNDPETPQQNNVLSGEVIYNESERFHTYRVNSQLNPTALAPEGSPRTTSENIANQKGESRDPDVRTSRHLTITSEQSADSESSTDRANWEKNIRKGQSEEYEAKLQGFYQDEEKSQVWKPNQIVRINDVFADLQTERLIKAVTYEFDIDGGSTTTLQCVATETYTIQDKIDEYESRNKNEGGSIVS